MLPNAAQELDEKARKTLTRLKNSRRDYAKYCLKTKTKNKNLVNVEFNRVQNYIDQECEDQKRRRGFVRKIIVKGRQQTCSTYVASRFYHGAQFEPGTNVFILSHEDKSTGVLFDKAKLFAEEIRKTHPNLSFANEKQNKTELDFTNHSTYDVGTAGSGSTGRGLTIRLFHGSECAFWDIANIDDILTGVLQTVALMENTEVILESTCNGYNWWYNFVMQALEVGGSNPYEVIFIPWWWTDEYRLPLQTHETWVWAEDELKLLALYGNEGLTDIEQFNWRRAKIAEFEANQDGLKKFRQEYPCHVLEGFQASGDPFFDSDDIQLALETEIEYQQPDVYARVLGVDSAGDSKAADRTVLTKRENRIMDPPEIYKKMTVPQLAEILKGKIDRDEIDHIFIDMAFGHGVVDLLKKDGYGDYITGVHFGGGADEPLIYLNKRAEMYHKVRKWLKDQPCEIKYENKAMKMAIEADYGMLPQPEQQTGSLKLKFIDKKELKKKFKRSPDILDSGALTFAKDVRRKGDKTPENLHTTDTVGGRSPLSTQNRIKEIMGKASPDMQHVQSKPRGRFR